MSTPRRSRPALHAVGTATVGETRFGSHAHSTAAVLDAPDEPMADPAPDSSQRAASESSNAEALKLWVTLARAHSAISAHATDDAARHGLTLAEFGIIEALYHRGPMLLGEVQRRILVSSGGITFLVDRLAEKGLVERRSCPQDRRARYAALTPRGEALVAEIFPKHAAVLLRAMSGLTADEQRAAAEFMRALGLHAAATPIGDSPDRS